MSRISVLYLGLHPHTPQWIEGRTVHVQGIGALEYFDEPGSNLANRFFQMAYAVSIRRTAVRLWYAGLWGITRHFVTGPFRRYRPHLDLKLFAGSEIVDISETAKIEEYIKNKSIDLLVINSWSLLPLNVIERPSHGTVNIHPSKLPKYRGSLPTLWALKNRDRESAVTFMMPDSGVDVGKIIKQYPFAISPTDTAIDIETTVEKIIREHLRKDIVALCQGSLVPQPQTGEASGTKRYQEYREILWGEETARDIYNKILLYPYLEWGLYCYWRFGNQVVEVTDAELGLKVALPPGAFAVRGGLIYIGAREGSIVLRLSRDIPRKISQQLKEIGTGTFL